MMVARTLTLLLLAGCIEYEPVTTSPIPKVPNVRPFEETTREDKLVQIVPPLVDVLFVVDDSDSMEEEQGQLAERFPLFLDYFVGSGLEYHIGVVSTDMDDPSKTGRLQISGGFRYITPETPVPDLIFNGMAMLGLDGSWYEDGLDAVFSAIEVHSQPGGYNEGFYRDDATLHIVTISDERDHSDIDPDDFSAWLIALKEDPEDVTFSSIIGLEEAPCPEVWSNGRGYRDVTEAVGGILWDICDDDWSEVLDRLGMQAAGLKREFFLSDLPVEDTIDVKVVEDGITFTFVQDEDWTYNQVRNSVTFVAYAPSPKAEVLVTYDLLAAKQ